MSQPIKKAAVLLAAGRGSRLAAVAEPYTKTFLEVAGRPIIGYGACAVEEFVNHIIVVGHPTTGEKAADAVRRSLTTHHLPVTLALQETPRGMADAMRIGFEALPHDTAAVVLAGDNIVLDPENIRRVFASLGTGLPGGETTLAWTYVEHELEEARRFSVYKPLSSKTGELVEKPDLPPSHLCWCGPVAFASTDDALRRIATLTPSDRGELEGPDLINTYLGEGRGRHLPLTGHWFDIGTPDALAEAEKIITQYQHR